MHNVCKRYYIETAITRPHAITQNNIMLCHSPVSITSFKLHLQRYYLLKHDIKYIWSSLLTLNS